jgi:hypothetical protein
LEQGIEAHYEGSASGILSRKMPADGFISDGVEAPVATILASDVAFVAQSPCPLVGAGRLVAGFAGFAAFETAGVDIFPASEQRAEKGDFISRWRKIIDGGGIHVRLMLQR